MKAYSYQTFDEYYIDVDTPNTSFAKMAIVLYNKGVCNCHFFLKLYNKKLIGVDPYDPHLSDDKKFMIFRECSENRWYFFREVFRVQETGASTDVGGGIAFQLNRGNLAYLWACELNLCTYLIMPRQIGKTWAAIADITWTHQFNKNTSVLHFNKDQSNANDNLRRIQIAIGMLPEYLQHSNVDIVSASEKRKVKNNEKTIRNVLNSTILAMSSAGNEAKADAMARGKTAEKIWYDEFAFIFFNGTIYSAATPAYEKASEVAQRNGVPYAITITTTPGDLASPHGAYAYKFMKDSIKFDESMYDLKYNALIDLVQHTPDRVPFVFIQYSYWQLGKTDEWYVEVSAKLHDPIKARREFLLEWIDTNADSPFDPDDIELIGRFSADREKGDHKIIKINKYFNLTVYSEYKGRKPVLIGVDVASGRGQDNSAVVVVNPETLMPMAFFCSNQIGSKHLRKFLMTLVNKLYPNCILTIENNSIGTPLIEELADTSIRRVLYRERKKKSIDVGARNFTKRQTRDVIEFGHNVNATTRTQMTEMLENVVHFSHEHMGFPELYEEIRHMIRKNGRIDHSAATHDDLTMAYMGVLWIIRYGKGLKGKGIYYNLRDNDDDGPNELDPMVYREFDQATRSNDISDEEKLIYEMMQEHDTDTARSVYEEERRQYLKELDRINGFESEDDWDDNDSAIAGIPDEVQRNILRHYYKNFNEPSMIFNGESFEQSGIGIYDYYLSRS